MHWFGRPPYVRWAAGTLVVVVAAWVELRPERTDDHPFAAEAIVAGQAIDADLISWREVPAGLLPLPDVASVTAARPIPAGAPLLPADVTQGELVPANWWSVPLPIPDAAPGTAARIVFTDGSAVVDGVVVRGPDDDPFSLEPLGLVAVPSEAAAAVASAASRGAVTVLVGP